MIETQLSCEYKANSQFQDEFTCAIGKNLPSLTGQSTALKAAWLDTPLGSMIAVSDENALLLLEFTDRSGLEKEVERLKKEIKSTIVFEHTAPIESIKNEISLYFQKKLHIFKTPLYLLGTPFQQQVWKQLQNIPYGATRSYLKLAQEIDRPTACRAVARANSANQLAIIIPCHRVIHHNGTLGGYAGGLERKSALFHHEKI